MEQFFHMNSAFVEGRRSGIGGTVVRAFAEFYRMTARRTIEWTLSTAR